MGQHNVLNATAAIIVSITLGISVEKIKKALENFLGVQRRLTKLYEKKNRIIKLNIEAKIKKTSELFYELTKIVKKNRTNPLKSRYNINIGQFIFYADHKDFGQLFNEVKKPDLKKIIISNYVKYFNKTSLRYKDSNKNSTTKKIVILYDGTDSYFKKIQQFNSAIADFLATGFLANGLPYSKTNTILVNCTALFSDASNNFHFASITYL